MKISTGFTGLDKSLSGGLPRCALVTIGARPAMGKSAFMHSLAVNFQNQGLDFRFYSFDMPKKEILARTKNKIDEKNIPIIAADINQILAHMKPSCDDPCCEIFFIDYLQLLIKYGLNDAHFECSNIMRDLKAFSMENNCLIILSSQLSRKPEERPSHRPCLTDLRDSGTIEEASDIVILLLRREVYDNHDKPGVADFIIAKNKYGECSKVDMIFKKEDCRFYDYMPYIYTEEDDLNAARTFSQFMPS